MTTTWAQRRKTRIDDLAAGRGATAQAWRGLGRSPMAVTGGVIVGSFVVVALLSPLLAPHGAAEVFPQLRSNPGAQPGHPLGGDALGRDVWSRMLLGSQQTLTIAVMATALGLAAGALVGVLAGLLGGWSDTALTCVVDALLAVPGLLLVIAAAALVASPSQATVIVAVAAAHVPVFAWLLRGTIRAQRTSEHAAAAAALGMRRRAVVLHHVLPHAIGPAAVLATLALATSIVDVAALSFLGLGDTDPDRAEWGLMLAQALPTLDVRPALVIYPAVAITLVALGFTLASESLRAALAPPGRQR